MCKQVLIPSVKLPASLIRNKPPKPTIINHHHCSLSIFVATTDNLNDIGRNANLDDLIIRNPSEAPGVTSRHTIADTVKAILGAVYHDANFDLVSVTPVMQNLGLGPV